MSRPQQYFNWHELLNEQSEVDVVENTRHRLRWIMALFAAALAVIVARAAQLEISDGESFRRYAATPLERTRTVAAPRGRILARDGTILAADRQVRALAVQYRYLERPLDPRWLGRLARARLSEVQRRQPKLLQATAAKMSQEVAELHASLAAACGISATDWQARSQRIQRRITAMAQGVDRRLRQRHESRQLERDAQSQGEALTVGAILGGLFAPPEPLPLPPITLAEQTAYHPLVDDPPEELIREIERRPDAYPGIKVVQFTRRDYPSGALAAHLVGYVSPKSGLCFPQDRPEQQWTEAESVGLAGIERQAEDRLRGENGQCIQTTDRRGVLLGERQQKEMRAGVDVFLTIDANLQSTCETLLDRTLRQLNKRSTAGADVTGGAVLVMSPTSGEVLAAASAPRFDPNWFALGDARAELPLSDARRPMIDRVAKMALPPGSLFKPLVALALLENHLVDPQAAFSCQGYWQEPDRLRCQIFRHHGIGHGDVTLSDALAQSCNVYFFEHVRRLGAKPMVEWSARLGLGQRTGADLSDEAPGHLPSPDELAALSRLQGLAIGQDELTATPLQMARLYAAIANGGNLVAPRFIRSAKTTTDDANVSTSPAASTESRSLGLDEHSLREVSKGLRRVVNDPLGTAFDHARLPWIAIAGKTGTAETGGDRADHAWFAGYAPADAPKFVFVVVLEHGGGAANAATLSKGVVQRMHELGYFGAPETAQRILPPGKG